MEFSTFPPSWHSFFTSPLLFPYQFIPGNYVHWTETPESHIYSADIPGILVFLPIIYNKIKCFLEANDLFTYGFFPSWIVYLHKVKFQFQCECELNCSFVGILYKFQCELGFCWALMLAI